MNKKHRPAPPAPAPAAAAFPRPLMAAAALAALLALAAIYWLTHGEPEGAADPAATAQAFLPAEFGRQAFLLVGGTQLVQLFPGVLADIVAAVHDHVRTIVLTGSAADRQAVADLLAGRGLPPDAVQILELPVLTMWVRDFGPLTVVTPAGMPELVDFQYRERRGNAVDDGVPTHLAAWLELPRRESKLLLEGGDLLSNGLGLCLSSTRIIQRNEYYQGWSDQEVAAELGRTLGFESWIPTPHLQGEPTGHVDLFAAFLRPDLVVVARYDAAADAENAALLDQAAAALSDVPTLAGPLQVERIDLPPHADGVWRSYTNVVFANGVLLVPTFPDCCPDLDARALALYRRLLPDWNVVGIDASGLAAMNGQLRCITMNGAAGRSAP